jgi:putative ABC transport system permease protein
LPPGELPAGFYIPRARIVGIVNDVHYEGLQDPPDPEVYAPLAQSDFFSTMSVAVRTLVPSTSLIPAIRAEVSDMDRELPIAKVATMDELAGSSVALPRLHTIRHEVGVRIALGARPRAIVWGIVARAMTLVAAGLLIGCGLALALTRLMSTLLFEVAPVDAPTFVGSAGLLLATSALASYLPARRAASVDPIVALRCE